MELQKDLSKVFQDLKQKNPKLNNEQVCELIYQKIKPIQYTDYINDPLEDQILINESNIDKAFIKTFCTTSCTNDCGDQFCMKYHENKDQQLRRIPYIINLQWSYSPYPCQDHNCLDEECKNAHNLFETLYHPDKFKTEMCESRLIDGICHKYGPHCYKAHDDVRNPTSPNQFQFKVKENPVQWFKIIKCREITIHDMFLCPYYHDYSDRRRYPIFYSGDMCELTQNQILDQCLFKDKCLSAHNEYEINYHPQKYKKVDCQYGIDCKFKDKFCPFKHEPFQAEQDRVLKEKQVKLSKLKTKCQSLIEELEKLQVAKSMIDINIYTSEYGQAQCQNCKQNNYLLILEGCRHKFCQDCFQNRQKCLICKQEGQIHQVKSFDEFYQEQKMKELEHEEEKNN